MKVFSIFLIHFCYSIRVPKEDNLSRIYPSRSHQERNARMNKQMHEQANAILKNCLKKVADTHNPKSQKSHDRMICFRRATQSKNKYISDRWNRGEKFRDPRHSRFLRRYRPKEYMKRISKFWFVF